MAARIDNGHAQLLTRTGLDWTAKYPGVIAALANLKVKTAYIDGELCGDDAGLPSFAHTRAASAAFTSSITLSISCTWQIGTSPSFHSSSGRRFLSLWSSASPAFNSMVTTQATAS